MICDLYDETLDVLVFRRIVKVSGEKKNKKRASTFDSLLDEKRTWSRSGLLRQTGDGLRAAERPFEHPTVRARNRENLRAQRPDIYSY